MLTKSNTAAAETLMPMDGFTVEDWGRDPADTENDFRQATNTVRRTLSKLDGLLDSGLLADLRDSVSVVKVEAVGLFVPSRREDARGRIHRAIKWFRRSLKSLSGVLCDRLYKQIEEEISEVEGQAETLLAYALAAAEDAADTRAAFTQDVADELGVDLANAPDNAMAALDRAIDRPDTPGAALVGRGFAKAGPASVPASYEPDMNGHTFSHLNECENCAQTIDGTCPVHPRRVRSVVAAV